MFRFWELFHPPPTAGGGGGGGGHSTFKIFCKADERYCLTVRDDGNLALAPANSSDEHQHWFRDMRFGTHVQDVEGNPAFSLVNKATGLAISHFGGPFRPVKLVPFNPDYLDDSALWTACSDMARGFGSIRTLTDIDFKLSAVHGDKDHGAAVVRLSDSCDGDDGRWKILPWSGEADSARARLGEPTFRIYCKANEGLSVTVRDGAVCLAPTDPRDKYQHWVEDTSYGDMIRDEDGYPAFTLVNRATGDAIKGSVGTVKLVPYNTDYLDKSVLWSKSEDVGLDFHYIRMVDNIDLNLGAFLSDKDHSSVHDGIQVVLSNWCEGNNQYWRMVPWSQEREMVGIDE